MLDKKKGEGVSRVDVQSVLHGYLDTIKDGIDELSSQVLCLPIISINKIRTFCDKARDESGDKYVFSTMLVVYLCYLESYTVQKKEAKWRDNSFLAYIPNTHVVKHTEISATAVKKYKAGLIKIGLIEVVTKNKKGFFKDYFLKVKFLPKNESIPGILGLIISTESSFRVGPPTHSPKMELFRVGPPTLAARRPVAIVTTNTGTSISSTSRIGIITSKYYPRHPTSFTCLRHVSNGPAALRPPTQNAPVLGDQKTKTDGKKKRVKNSSPAPKKEKVTYGVSPTGAVIDHGMVVGAITLLLQVVPTDAEAYAKKTTRKAVIDLLKVRTIEQIGAVVSAVLSKLGDQYFPKVPYNVLDFAKGWPKYEQASMRNTSGQSQSNLRNIPGYTEAYSGGPKTKKDQAYVQWVKARKTRQIPEDLTFDAYVVNNNIDIKEN